MKEFEVISTVTRLPKKDVSDARKKAEITAVLQAIAEKNHYSASEFEAVCKENNVTVKTVLQYVKHDTDYIISRIYDFIPWNKVDESAEIPFTGYGSSGTQVFQEADGVYICEVVKSYYFPTCYEVSFNYHGIISGSMLTEDFPCIHLPMYKRALKKAVSSDNFYNYALHELQEKYAEDCIEWREKLDFDSYADSYNMENKTQEMYEDFLENAVLQITEMPITKENINCWYNILDCIAYKQDPEFDLD